MVTRTADVLSHVLNEQLSTKVDHNTIRDLWQYSSTPSDHQDGRSAHPVPSQDDGDNRKHPSSSVDNGDSEALSMTTIYSVGAVVIVLLCVVLALLLKGLVGYLISFYSMVNMRANIKNLIFNITLYYTISYLINLVNYFHSNTLIVRWLKEKRQLEKKTSGDIEQNVQAGLWKNCSPISAAITVTGK